MLNHKLNLKQILNQLRTLNKKINRTRGNFKGKESKLIQISKITIGFVKHVATSIKYPAINSAESANSSLIETLLRKKFNSYTI